MRVLKPETLFSDSNFLSNRNSSVGTIAFDLRWYVERNIYELAETVFNTPTRTFFSQLRRGSSREVMIATLAPNLTVYTLLYYSTNIRKTTKRSERLWPSEA